MTDYKNSPPSESSDEEEPELLKIRRKNLEIQKAFMIENMPEMQHCFDDLKEYGNGPNLAKRRAASDRQYTPRMQRKKDRQPQRRSLRLANIPAPVYDDGFSDHEDGFSNYKDFRKKRLNGMSDTDSELDGSIDDEDAVTPLTGRRHRRYRHSVPEHVPPLMACDVTEAMIKNIAQSSQKTYSQTGTTCHQCRQKTVDTKTVCRSKTCSGVRGQFCGPCLKNRYGENVADALRNDSWSCPPCRELCNCSICRNREGKRPTGILAPIVQKHGHDSVKDFLLHLEDQKKKRHKKCVPKEGDVLGFKDGEAVLLGQFVPKVGDLLGFDNGEPKELKNLEDAYFEKEVQENIEDV